MIRFFIHYGMHFVVPAGFALWWGRGEVKRIYLLFLLSMLIDLDHLLANPIYDPNRCSLGYHPLHSIPAAIVYLIMLGFPRLRWWGIALIFHLITDGVDCALSKYFT